MNKGSQFGRCKYASRGCERLIRKPSSSHHRKCDFAPVQCSHDGCEVTVNRRDLFSHKQNCEFRSVTCEECDETMEQKDYEEHVCVLRKELAEARRLLQGMQDRQLVANQPRAAQGQQDNNLVQLPRQPSVQQNDNYELQGTEILQFETTQVQQVVTQLSQLNSTRRQQSNNQLTRPSSFDHCGRACSISRRSQRQLPVEGEIVVAGGASYLASKSYEVFNWSTQQWTLYRDALFFDHTDGFSFFYDNKVMFCGGTGTNRVECLDIANYRTVCTFPSQLPGKNCGKGALCGDEIFTFGYSVSVTSLQYPFRSSVCVLYDDKRKFSNYGIACVNDNAVVVVGGDNSYTRIKYDGRGRQYNESEKRADTDDVVLYNPSTNAIRIV